MTPTEAELLRAVVGAARQWWRWEADHSQSMVSRNSMWDAVDDAFAALDAYRATPGREMGT